MKRWLFVALASASAWRGFVSWKTPIPSEDGVNYLWMAEQFAAGRFRLAMSEVFPPLPALAVAPLAALGMDPFRAGQLVSGLAGVLAAAVAYVAARRVSREGSATMAAVLLAFSPLLVRFGAECYSEPLFVLCAALAVDAGLAGRHARSGMFSGLAFWVRPEGLLVAAGFLLAEPRRALRSLPPLAAAVAALSGWRGLCGQGFFPIAKAPLIAERAVTAAPSLVEALEQFANNAVRLPWLWVEAFGLLGLAALFGFVRLPRGPVRRALAGMVSLDVAVIAAFLARRRFLLSQAAAVTVAAARGLGRLERRSLRVGAMVLGLASSLVLGARVMAPDRAAERAVGRYLGARLAPDETLATDMTRVRWFAGRRPLPPRRFSVAEIVAMARAPGVRFVVLGSKRPGTKSVCAALEDRFAEMQLPEPLQAAARARGIVVLAPRR